MWKKIKIKGNLKVFKLNQIYESHEDSIEEIYTRFDKGSPYYIGSISEILNKKKNKVKIYKVLNKENETQKNRQGERERGRGREG